MPGRATTAVPLAGPEEALTTETSDDGNGCGSTSDGQRASSNPEADAAMERYACGDASAFAPLYDALVRPLYGLARSFTRDDERASELVQQTFVRICEKRGTFVAGSLVTPWAQAILANLFRDQARRKRVEVPDDDGTPDSASDAPDPEECTSTRELSEQLRRACERLTPEQVEAFELVHYGQMTHAEAAEVLDVSVASVTLRIQRAMQTLRETFRQEDPQ